MSGAQWQHGLLVSVRNAAEADVVAAAGAAIVDVKEPNHGPLGPADPDVAAAIVAAVAGRAAVTLACGELAAGVDTVVSHVEGVLRCLPASTVPPVAIKVGPAGLAWAEWRTRFDRLAARLPVGIEAVPVAYADCASAAAPIPEAIMAAAIESGAGTLLVDTFDKTGPGLFEAIDPPRLSHWAVVAAAGGIALALAGRLSAADVAIAFTLGADICGVRTAACEGGRKGPVSAQLVRRLVTLGASRPRRRALNPCRRS